MPMLSKFWQSKWWLLLIMLVLWLGFDLLSHLGVEYLWFEKIGYLQVWLLRFKTQILLWLIGFSTTAFFMLGNLAIAKQFEHPFPPKIDITPKFRLRILLFLSISFCLLIGLLLIHYGKIAIACWSSDLNIPSVSLPIPSAFDLASILLSSEELSSHLSEIVVLLIVTISVIVNPFVSLGIISVLLSLGFSFILAANWAKFLQYFHPISFDKIDPLFQQDISFYIFKLPVLELLEFWLIGLFLYVLISVTLIYLLSGNSLSQGSLPDFTPKQRRHLNGLGGILILVLAWYYWLLRYQLLYHQGTVFYGAGFTAVNVQLPIYTILTFIGLVIGIFLLWQSFFLSGKVGLVLWSRFGFSRLVYSLLIYLTIGAIAGSILPAILQRLLVQPNEIARERPYIQHSINFTRQAFNLDSIEDKVFNPEGKLTDTDIQKNHLTIRNIRLWDTRPLLQTNRQLQQIRPYYKFVNADIDRYSLKPELTSKNPDHSEKQQVILAARELDYNAVPIEAQTWVNEHLIYTHGYGFTVSPVNKVAPGGLPDYFVKDIGIDAGGGDLKTSSDRIKNSIPTAHPRIYYGEITNTYVIVPTQVQELDYPNGNENIYNHYDGNGGININSIGRKLLFAKYLNDWQMLLTRNFTNNTKILFRRNINQRIRAIAPFLRYDSDPYLVVANLHPDSRPSPTENYLYWIIDAYTTSDHYPYSDPGKKEFNYIRNSVKIVIDAYHGDITFYVTDLQEPIITSWMQIFPGMFKPLNEIPNALRSHLRYPGDLFSIQSERLLTYHMEDPQVFYNREDQWQVPIEIYGREMQPVEPYYLIMKLPTEATEEFILLLPFTPTKRTNLIAWLAASSDSKEYGKLLLYKFPKQELIYGVEQIEALINQDPVISQQISLWNREGARALQGNLLVIPIERSLLYVEPLYLEAEKNSLPTLARVIVVYQNQIVMAPTLEQSIKAIFQPAKPIIPAIIRPVQK